MAKFIEIHNSLINVESIRKVDFVSDDIYMGLFPIEDGEVMIDYISFTFATIELNTAEKIDLEIDLYPPEEGEKEEDWIRRNRAYISMSWNSLLKSLEDVIEVTGFEYRNC